MGLIKAAIITAIIYFSWTFIKQTQWMQNMPLEMRCSVTQYVLIALIFFIELLI
jgi:hypothetical protein